MNQGKLISSGEHLDLGSASSQSSGVYECLVSNGVDSQLKKIINIRVNGK